MSNKARISFWSEVAESFAMARAAIIAHLLRSVLTLLGVLIGVFSIIVVMTAMRVLQGNIERQFSSLGSSTFMIRKWPNNYFGDAGDLEKYWRRPNITLTDVKRLEAATFLPASIGVETTFWSGQLTTRHRTSAPNVRLYGGTPGTFPARNWNLAEGRLILDADVEGARNVCVLGSSLATNVFPNIPPVGESVKIDGINYLVVGLLEARGASMGGDQDNFAVIPVTAGLNRYGRSQRSLNILVQARDRERFDQTVDEVRCALRVIQKTPPASGDAFEISSNDSIIDQFKSFTFSVRVGVAVVSSIALLAAGIGIMNIMLVSVTERTREIGIRRAIGARRRNIMAQFIMEAVVLCQLGGVAGVILGIVGGNILAMVLKLPPALPLDWVFIGLGICSLVGIVFGTYPAWKAANLDPIESLRYE